MKSCLAIRSANNSFKGWGGNHDKSLVLTTEQPSNNYYLYFVWQHRKTSKDTQPIKHNNQQPPLHYQPCQPRYRMYLPSHCCHSLHTSQMTHVRRTPMDTMDRLFAIFCNLQESDTLLESNGNLHLEWQPTNALDHTMKLRCISLAKLSPIMQSIWSDGIW